MHRLSLAPDVFMCATIDRGVLLDLKRDTYWALDTNQLDAIHQLTSGRLDEMCSHSAAADLSAFADGLVGQGLLTSNPESTALPGMQPLPPVEEPLVTRDAIFRAHVTCTDVTRFIQSAATTTINLKLRSLHCAVNRLRERGTSASPPSNATLQRTRELTARFGKIRPFMYQKKDGCLFDSIVMLEFLHRHGIRASLAIGVQLQPFLAHSWVQMDRFVLNGTPEFTRSFIPILTV